MMDMLALVWLITDFSKEYCSQYWPQLVNKNPRNIGFTYAEACNYFHKEKVFENSIQKEKA